MQPGRGKEEAKRDRHTGRKGGERDTGRKTHHGGGGGGKERGRHWTGSCPAVWNLDTLRIVL